MAIVKMSKFYLATFAAEKDALMQSLQQFGDVHLLRSTIGEEEDAEKRRRLRMFLRPVNNGKKKAALSERLTRIESGLKALEPFEEKPSFLQGLSNALPAVSLAATNGGQSYTDEEIVEKLDRLEGVLAKRRDAEETIRQAREKREMLGHWKQLDVPAELLHQSKRAKVYVGTIPTQWTEKTRQFVAQHMDQTYIEFLSSDAKFAYVFLIDLGAADAMQEFLRDISFQPVHFEQNGTVDQQLERLERSVAAAKETVRKTEAVLRSFSKEESVALEVAYEEDAEHLKRLEAQEKLKTSTYVSFMEGYVPTEKEEAFRGAIARVAAPERVMLTIQPAAIDDPDVPILLKNNRIVAPFESIVRTYSLPQYKEMDPTGLIAPWYILFFSIMLGDLGYGFLLFLGTTLALKFLRFKPQTEQSLRFFQVLSIPTMIAGLCFGSLFGGLIKIPALIIDPTVDFMTMIIVSVALGFVHILVGLLLKAVQLGREGEGKAIVYDVLSWFLILIGLVLVGLTMGLGWSPFLKTVGFAMAAVGALLILLFSARAEKGAGRFAWGLYNLYGATSYIGDLVSYTRLTAILLAGAYIGFAMNMIAGMLTGIGIPGVIVAAVILLGAHLFNLFLSSLSAYVHAMRLIYVEFFGKFFEGGGVPFEGLQTEPKYARVKEDRG